ncbi:hypothetical protein [Nonomuraea recticatena]|uniref:MarR family transcriptional regulator n=1 Tax=Nonomuraea recticatena TaxID=46178 RepID=A0ABN3SNA6_9ACTN
MDNRAVLVHITATGTAIVEGRRTDRIAHLADLTGRLTPAEWAPILAALPALRRLVDLDQQSEQQEQS